MNYRTCYEVVRSLFEYVLQGSSQCVSRRLKELAVCLLALVLVRTCSVFRRGCIPRSCDPPAMRLRPVRGAPTLQRLSPVTPRCPPIHVSRRAGARPITRRTTVGPHRKGIVKVAGRIPIQGRRGASDLEERFGGTEASLCHHLEIPVIISRHDEIWIDSLNQKMIL